MVATLSLLRELLCGGRLGLFVRSKARRLSGISVWAGARGASGNVSSASCAGPALWIDLRKVAAITADDDISAMAVFKSSRSRAARYSKSRSHPSLLEAIVTLPHITACASRDGIWPAVFIRCLIPRFDGAILSLEWKEAVWGKFVIGAPRPRTPSKQQYSDRKLRSRR